jgi:hypothetical protein
MSTLKEFLLDALTVHMAESRIAMLKFVARSKIR